MVTVITGSYFQAPSADLTHKELDVVRAILGTFSDIDWLMPVGLNVLVKFYKPTILNFTIFLVRNTILCLEMGFVKYSRIH